ncbi:MAG: cysteine desulfurase [Actinobacteria bacterium]|nr:cysteine desulfurase [Actinomycetota bacterium]
MSAIQQVPTSRDHAIDVARLREQFPILHRTVRDEQRLIYLDSGATSQKPLAVLDAERDYYLTSNAAVHRGAHQLAEEATEAYEGSRARIAAFVGARAEQLVFTRNATESLNLLAYAFSNTSDKARTGAPRPDGSDRLVIGPGDEILITEMEHHANLIPWQEVCAKTGATLRWIPLTPDGRLDLGRLPELLTSRTRVVSFVHQSNLVGTINPVREIARAARDVGAWVFLDACQSVPHMPIDVNELGVDAVAWSGHKMLGPTGIGCLWATDELLYSMPPFISGGSMIEVVTMEASTFADPPKRFEAGVPMVAQAVGLSAACDVLDTLGMDAVAAHEADLTAYALAQLDGLVGVRVVGPASTEMRGSAISFVVEGVHPHDVGQILDSRGIAVRVGHQCAWPACRALGVPATTRISPYVYNDRSDIDAFIEALDGVRGVFGFH